VAASVAIQFALRHWVDIGQSFEQKPNPALVSVSATTASFNVVILIGESAYWPQIVLVIMTNTICGF
jgi:hypothetical protein